MDEAAWLACTDLRAMLEFLRDKASERKLRLFACACCRQAWRLLTDPRSRAAVEAAERHADGVAGDAELAGARTAAQAAFQAPCRQVASPQAAYDAWGTAAYMPGEAAHAGARPPHEVPVATQAAILRDLFGPLPFRAVAIHPAWLTWDGGAVGRLGQAAYDNRALPAGTLNNARLAILADALEEAGCADATLLGHLRSGGEHYRGCFAVDLLLGLA